MNVEQRTEIFQLRNNLDSNDPSLRKVSAKRVVALMRQGENVRQLFSSMLRCVKTDDIELKKLTYLYLTQYSVHEPEQSIMTVNTFIQDSQDGNPLVRALAVRTMCRIKLDSVAENMILPLKKCLTDPDPYVRKTAALGVAKLYEIVPESVENSEIFNVLINMLNDDNPMVISNASASIFEINERRTTPIFKLTKETISPILNAISSSSEWCQTSLFDCIAKYVPDSPAEAHFLIDRLAPLLKQSNPAVVIGAFKCIYLLLEYSNKDTGEIFGIIIPPLITLLSSSPPQIQYVVLRTLNLFVLKYPKILSKDMRIFFCKYNDPSYVKMEKLELIAAICTPRTVKLVLDELSEYCNSVDVAFVRKAIQTIGYIAMKIERTASRCVDILVGVVKGKADYAIEEAICVVTDILRKFPGDFEGVIQIVCSNLSSIKGVKAKSSAIWILGEYSRFIDNVDEIIDPFLDSFRDEDCVVQLQLLATLVKIYLEKPDTTKDQLQFILTEATKDGNFPDVKNRAYIYWRVLSQDKARDVLTFPKTTVINSRNRYDQSILDELIRNTGSVSGVLHIIPSDFVQKVQYVPEEEDYDIRDLHRIQLFNQNNVDVFIGYSPTKVFLRITNNLDTPLSGFAFALNVNAIGLSSGKCTFPPVIVPGATEEAEVELVSDLARGDRFDVTQLQIAIRTNVGTLYGADGIPVEILFSRSGDRGQEAYRESFNTFTNEATTVINNSHIADRSQLTEKHIYIVGRNKNAVYVQFYINNDNIFVAELIQDGENINVLVKTNSSNLLPIVMAGAHCLFSQK